VRAERIPLQELLPEPDAGISDNEVEDLPLLRPRAQTLEEDKENVDPGFGFSSSTTLQREVDRQRLRAVSPSSHVQHPRIEQLRWR